MEATFDVHNKMYVKPEAQCNVYSFAIGIILKNPFQRPSSWLSKEGHYLFPFTPWSLSPILEKKEN
jgi:hypothetical protein